MLKRKITQRLTKWIEEDRKEALLVTGARQVGKTFIIDEVLKSSGRPYAKFNLLTDSDFALALNLAAKGDSELLFSAIQAGSDGRLPEGSFVFIDEIQECKDVLSLIKPLVEAGRYHYIFSGSLLGVELIGLRSAPVGFLETFDMYPLDFEEFMWAMGMTEELYMSLRRCYIKESPVTSEVHDYMINNFYRYLVVGGMPSSVVSFLKKRDIADVFNDHARIRREYNRDFTKYEEKDKLRLRIAYERIPDELSKENRRYILASIDEKLRFETFERNFDWLREAGVALPCYCVGENKIPLSGTKKRNLFKLFLSDVGMLSSMYGSATVLSILGRSENLRSGGIFENFIAQELKSHGFDLYYSNQKKTGEIDFLIEQSSKIVPIEVKSGKNYHTHRALSNFMKDGTFEKGIVFSPYNVEKKENILYLPIYMAGFLENDAKLPVLDILPVPKPF